MDINNISAEVESALESLRQKDSYIKKHTILDDYQKLNREITDKRQQMESFVKSLDLDNAQLAKDELNELENRKEILQTTYEEYNQLPDYEDADLLSIYKGIKAAGDAAIDQITEQQAKLFDQIIQLQQEKNRLSYTLDECIQTVLDKSARRDDIRFEIKFRKFAPLLNNINKTLAKLLDERIDLYNYKNSFR